MSALGAVAHPSDPAQGRAFFEGVDVLLTPALAGPAPNLGAFPTATDDVEAHVARMLTFSPYTAFFNVTGQPAIVLPLTTDPAGLPVWHPARRAAWGGWVIAAVGRTNGTGGAVAGAAADGVWVIKRRSDKWLYDLL